MGHDEPVWPEPNGTFWSTTAQTYSNYSTEQVKNLEFDLERDLNKLWESINRQEPPPDIIFLNRDACIKWLKHYKRYHRRLGRRARLVKLGRRRK